MQLQVFDGTGNWRQLAVFPLGTWIRVEYEFEQGDGAAKTFDLRLVTEGADPVVRCGLSFSNTTFTQCTWFGLAGMDEEKSVFHVDDIVIE